MNIIGMYKNGNYKVIILDDGTKIRYNNEDFLISDTVESMDIKITNMCDIKCPMCHENSLPNGKHADIMNCSFIDKLHPYTELAIGGGNPLSHPDLIPFLEKCKNLKLIPSMTINQKHFMDNLELINMLINNKLIYGLGISLVSETEEFLTEVQKYKNAVIHVINGLISVSRLEKLKNRNLKILILGYKEVRRGKDLYSKIEYKNTIDKIKADMLLALPNIIKEKWFNTISFDNLALEQLKVKDLMNSEEWEKFYMGDDGIGDNFDSATMYIDMVEKKFAKNSCDNIRYDLLSTVDEMYTFLRDKHYQNSCN